MLCVGYPFLEALVFTVREMPLGSVVRVYVSGVGEAYVLDPVLPALVDARLLQVAMRICRALRRAVEDLEILLAGYRMLDAGSWSSDTTSWIQAPDSCETLA